MSAAIANVPASVSRDSGNRPGRFDAVIVLLLLLLGLFQVATVQRLESYWADSSVYMVAAHNLRASGSYEFDYKLETVYPPGFPLLLAGISAVMGSESYLAYVRAMPVFTTLALVVWYFVLRRSQGRAVAAACCLLAGTSAPLYEMVTRSVPSEAPFFLFSGIAVWCLMALETSEQRRVWVRVFLVACLCFAVAMTVLLRSAGIALCAGLLAWAGIQAARRETRGSAPWRTAAIAAIVGAIAFACWIGWARSSENRDYQGQQMASYASQFAAKDPHQPELGQATPADFVLRMAANLPIQASHIARIATRAGYIVPVPYSPLTAISVTLLALGFAACAFDRRQALVAWYFLAYFAVYLLWPFDEGPRFMLPVAPIALALMWQGTRFAGRLLRAWPAGALGAITALGAILTAVALTSQRLPGFQAKLMMAFWPMLAMAALAAAVLAWRFGTARTAGLLTSLNGTLFSRPVRAGAAACLVVLCAAGVLQDTAEARANLAPDPAHFRHYSSADFSAWLGGAGAGVVMAQQTDIVHRLSGRKTVAFPITRNPDLIVGTMKRETVRFLVVNDRVKSEYFFPIEEDRWRQVDRTYGPLFRMVHRGPGYRVFEFAPAPEVAAARP